MVFRGGGQRHQYAGHAQQAQFAHADRTRACHHHVGHGIRQVHAGDEGHHFASCVVVCLYRFFRLLLKRNACLPDHLHAFRLQCRQGLRNAKVDAARTQAATGDEHHRPTGAQAEESHCFPTFSGHVQHFASHRIAREQHVARREVALHAGIRRTHAAGPLAQHAVGGTGQAVLLLQHRGDASALRCRQHGAAGVTACAHRHVRPEGAHDVARAHQALQQAPRQADVLQQRPALEPADRQACDGEARRRHLFHFHLAFRAHEEEARVRYFGFHRLRDGHGREDVAARAPAGKQHAKRLHGRGWWCCVSRPLPPKPGPSSYLR